MSVSLYHESCDHCSWVLYGNHLAHRIHTAASKESIIPHHRYSLAPFCILDGGVGFNIACFLLLAYSCGGDGDGGQ